MYKERKTAQELLSLGKTGIRGQNTNKWHVPTFHLSRPSRVLLSSTTLDMRHGPLHSLPTALAQLDCTLVTQRVTLGSKGTHAVA